MLCICSRSKVGWKKGTNGESMRVFITLYELILALIVFGGLFATKDKVAKYVYLVMGVGYVLAIWGVWNV